ncbi:putative reverse transcriptase domain-containing protein [Tanacetum coccineum]
MVGQTFNPRHKMGLNMLLDIIILDYIAFCPITTKSCTCWQLSPVDYLLSYTISSRSTGLMMDATAQNKNNTTIRSILPAKKLTGLNFTNWYRNLRMFLRYEEKMNFVEQPIGPAPDPKTTDPDTIDKYYESFNLKQEVACLTLSSMSPDLQRTLEKYNAFNMIKELETMFEEQAKQGLFETVKAFHACKQEDGQSVSSYLLKMKSYLDTLECLGYAMPKELGVSLILNSLNKDYDQFVHNYNMHSMGKTLAELHDMLKLYEKGEKGKAKGKNKLALLPRPKIPPPPKRDNPEKDSICYHCKEVGHWRRNCLPYHAELKKRKNSSVASTSGSRKLKHGALSLYMGNGMRAAIEAIGSFDLILPSCLIIVLDNSKHGLDSYYLLHRRLGHINKKCMDMLQREGLLQPTYNESHEKCKSCISGKMARKHFPYQVERAKDLLGLIHTDVCGPFRVVSREGANYFITFTNDFSHYGFVYLMKHKHDVFETFKVFQNELENLLGKKIKTIRSDQGGEYLSHEFVNHMKSCGIAPPSPDYVSGPEYPPSPEFVLEPPLTATVSPTADSPGYVPESDPEEDPEEDDDEDPEEDPADYPVDGGDDGDDEDASSDDDEDEDVDIEGDEEEEHPAHADSTAVALPAVDQAPSAEETEPFETDESAATPPPHPVYRVTLLDQIRDYWPPTPFWSDTKIPSPPLPLILSQLPLSPSLPISSPLLPASPIYPLGYRAAMIRLRAEAPSTSHSPPPHIILSHTRAVLSHRIALSPRYEVGESSSAPTAKPLGGFWADYGFVATIDREIIQDLERDVGYGIIDTWDEMPVDMSGALATDDTKLGRRMTEFTTRVRQDTDEIYTRLDDEQSEQQLMAGRLNMLYRDRRAHARTARLMEVVAQKAVITELQVANRRRQSAITEMLVADRRRQEQFIEALRLLKRLQTQMTEFERQQGPAKRPAQTDAPEEAAGVRWTERTARECTYTDFLKCQPLNFKGKEGVVGLSQWFERMESVFHISNCIVENQVKFATCTLHSVDLTWWNTHVKTVGHDAAYGIPWKTLMKMMTDKYCPRNEIKKLEIELPLLCGRMFSEEYDKIEKYVSGLPYMIHGSVVASKPKTMQDEVEIRTELMDKKICTFAECQTKSKRKFEDTSRNTQNQQQQQQNKRQNTSRVYTAGTGEKKQYGGSKPLFSKCNYHHDGPCTPKCQKCNKVGHFARDCRSTANANNANNYKGTGLGQKPTCYECGVQGHFKRECPNLKNNNNRGNQVRGGNALAKVYMVRHGGQTQTPTS